MDTRKRAVMMAGIGVLLGLGALDLPEPGVRASDAAVGALPDGDRHPQVCAVVANLGTPTGPLVAQGSGVLIAPDVVLTAAHVADNPGDLFNRQVTCEPEALTGTFRVGFTGVAHPEWVRGVFPRPEDLGGVDNHDIGVLLLDEAIPDVRVVKLPRLGFLDALYGDCAGEGEDEECPSATVVGYGASARGAPGRINSFFWPGRGTRKALRADFSRLTAPYVVLAIATLPGDSGGPAFQAGTGMLGGGRVLGTFSGTTGGINIFNRLDTESAHAFLSQFVDLATPPAGD